MSKIQGRKRKVNNKPKYPVKVRSGYEARIIQNMLRDGIKFEYEPFGMIYVLEHEYTPDFELKKNGVLIEASGHFTSAKRTKLLEIKKQHPNKEIKLLFQADNKLNRRSKTRYSDWCRANGFEFAIGEVIPKSWLI